jgi:hypothetical protein
MMGVAATSAGRCRLLTAVALALTLAACGPGSTPGSDDGLGRAAFPAGGDAAAALAKWRTFPVTADPRPLVLTNGPVRDPASGFSTGEGKIAYIEGSFELAGPLPSSPPTSAGYALITARAALDSLIAMGTPEPPPAPHPLRILAVSLGRAPFDTDRGPRVLPAWRFTLAQATEPAWVLAVDRKYLWRSAATEPVEPDLHAGVSSDGRSVTYHFTGSPAACMPDYAGDAVESRTAVVVRIREVTVDSSDRGCPAIGVRRTVPVRLAAPLGARVLVSTDGSAVPVTSR